MPPAAMLRGSDTHSESENEIAGLSIAQTIFLAGIGPGRRWLQAPSAE